MSKIHRSTSTQSAATAEHNFNILMKRYASIIPEPERLLDTLKQPLPITAWANPLKIASKDLPSFFSQAQLQPLSWWAQCFRFQTNTPLGKAWPYLCGLIQIQEEVSMLPAVILNPQPGETILDLCAAPGNKTAQAATLLNNTGAVYANDCNLGRLRATGQIIKRLGLTNVNIVINDGVQFPIQTPFFDRIIVDAPCSCEGTLRKSLSKTLTLNPGNSQRLAQTQIALLKKAIQLTKPGGRLVYSTCTFAPEENEAVIDTILKQYPDDITVEKIHLDHFLFSPGIEHWNGRAFHPSIQNTWRIWPHLNNTGGFYIALLKKKGTHSKPAQSTPPQPKSERVKQYIQQVQERFHFPTQLMQQSTFLEHSNRGLYITTRENSPLPKINGHTMEVDCHGLFFLKTNIRFPKISSSIAMLWGAYAQKNTVQLNEDQVAHYIQKQDIHLTPVQRVNCTDTGYVIVQYQTISLGLGIIFERTESKPWPLRSLFPGYFS